MVNIRFDGDISMRADEAMPDRPADAPPITAEDVKAEMEKHDGKSRTLNDWALMREVRVYVSIGNGAEVEVWP